MTREDKIDKIVEEMIYKEIISLKENKLLLDADMNFKIQSYFMRNLGDDSESWRKHAYKIYQLLIDREYILPKREFLSEYLTFSPGINFDEWSSKMNVDNNQSSGINIGAVTANNLQIGNGNNQSNSLNINMSELVDRISKSNDQVAKNKLRELLENNTVASIIGAGISSLIALL